MDLLANAWTIWNEELGASIATIVALLALTRAAGNDIRHIASSIWRWKEWTAISRAVAKLEILYKLHKAKRIVGQLLEEHKYTINIREYDDCLMQDPMKATRERWDKIIPAKPTWLNDYYFAAALESLVKKKAVVKAIKYDPMSWPPRPEIYLFIVRNTRHTVSEEAFTIETNSKCAAYQKTVKCSQPDRFELRSYAETVSARETQFKSFYQLREGASPCERCWEKEERENEIRMLVDNITKYDLAGLIASGIKGENGEFKAAIVDECIMSECTSDPVLIRSVVTKAVELRKNQLARHPAPGRNEWINGETEEFMMALKKYIKTLQG